MNQHQKNVKQLEELQVYRALRGQIEIARHQYIQDGWKEAHEKDWRFGTVGGHRQLEVQQMQDRLLRETKSRYPSPPRP